ncbi:MAG: hypothetical protein ACRDZZ_15765 [Ilumatobacteraceae bacterium]
MDLTPHLEALRADLETVAGVDEALAPALDRVLRAVQPAFHLRMLDALGEAALELTDQLPDVRVGVQLAGRDIVLTLTTTEPGGGADAPAHDDDTMARLTLRMPERLKASVEQAAARDAISTNSWLVAAVHHALGNRQRRRGPGHRLTGYAEA